MSEHLATVEAGTEITEAAAPASAPLSGPEGTGITAASATQPEQYVAISDLLVEEVSIDGMCGVY